MAQGKIITRFAPSPTGYLHVGAARTALFAWLWARKNQGEFHLRIEDTDRKRLVPGAEEQIKKSLEWLGLNWDEKIMRQSDRLETYRKYADQLINSGHAEEAEEKEGKVVRFKWPEQKPIKVEPFHGRPKITIDPEAAASAFEDFVLIKSDRYPTYNFAHIIDDLETGVTDVIRGDEFTSSLNKYYALYTALGKEKARPRYYHVPTIKGPDGKKLSKRHGAKDVLEYRAEGYLPESLANFIALIGWNPGDDREFFASLADLTRTFDVARIQRSPGVFDPKKLRWLNGEHLKQLGAAGVLARAQAEGFWNAGDPKYDEKVLALAAERVETMTDLKEVQGGYFYQAPNPTPERISGNENQESVAVWLERTLRDLAALPESSWKPDRLEGLLTDVRNELDLEPKQLYPPLRVAVTDSDKTPPLWDIFATLGKKETVARIEKAQAKLA